MPIYEFRCRTCGEAFETIRPMGDAGEDVECPVCGTRGADRLPSSFSAGGTGPTRSGSSCGTRRFG